LTSRGPDRSTLLGNPKTRTTFAELLIDDEEDRKLRAVLVGMFRETERGARSIESQRLVKRRTSSCPT
jgi:hypothetical protein